MRHLFIVCLLACFTQAYGQGTSQVPGPKVKIANGWIQGTTETGGIRSFKGIPYAEPPIGQLRWREPRPAKNWSGVKMTTRFGPKALQLAEYADMVSRSNGKSEDCLYLNVWAPEVKAGEKRPVLVYFYGGGFVSGDGSEYRYDGESMARKGIITVTLNYRLGIFGFLSHPELTKESAHRSSGNYGLMDQHAALLWVQRNIAAFGGDPQKVTIAGESAGSMSVCAQMASPLSKGLFQGAIGESGSALGTASPVPLQEAERAGVQFTQAVKAGSIADLRKLPAEQLLQLSQSHRFPTTVDGYFLPESTTAIFSTGRQMDVPLLAGWNSAEVDYHALLGKEQPTLEAYTQTVKRLYGPRAEEVLKVYAAKSDSDVVQVATDLASDRFIVYNTWKFIDLHSKTNGYPVYRYLFSRQPFPANPPAGGAARRLGAIHASEIDYAMGNLQSNKLYSWTADDFKVSELMQNYFANFVKTGNPNGEGLPKWYGMQSSIPKVMIIDVNTRSEPEKNLRRYVLLDAINSK